MTNNTFDFCTGLEEYHCWQYQNPLRDKGTQGWIHHPIPAPPNVISTTNIDSVLYQSEPQMKWSTNLFPLRASRTFFFEQLFEFFPHFQSLWRFHPVAENIMNREHLKFTLKLWGKSNRVLLNLWCHLTFLVPLPFLMCFLCPFQEFLIFSDMVR